MFGSVATFHFYSFGLVVSICGLLVLLAVMYVWWRDVIRESSYLGYHSARVRTGLKYGFILFVVSEALFFVCWFWAFFHSSLVPDVEIGAVWPPFGLTKEVLIDPLTVPLLNTVLLLSSGVFITYSHKSLLDGNLTVAIYSLAITIALGLEFTALQIYEYFTACFSISDSIYGTVFYIITGFHGFHVVVGTIFLIVCLIRLMAGQLSQTRNLGYEFAIWYWHFVDAIWLFVYTVVYNWSSLSFFSTMF